MTMNHSLSLLALMAVFLLTACETRQSSGTAPISSLTGAKPSSAGDSSAKVPPPTTMASHDPSHPPIDCPLRKQGINSHDMKPFEDVEKYIAFLEREDRATWQKPDEVVKALKLSGSETVADLGAGSGYFSFRFAKALPKGKVVAIDIEPEMIRHIHHKAMTTSVNNVEAKLARPDDPSVPTEADWVFICDVLHHVKNRDAWLAKLHEQTKPEAKVALIEFKEGDLPTGPPASLKISKKDICAVMKKAGFEPAGEESELLPYQHLLVFSKG